MGTVADRRHQGKLFLFSKEGEKEAERLEEEEEMDEEEEDMDEEIGRGGEIVLEV